jgi:copper chaperone
MRELTVPDMDCEGCVQAITRAVQRLDPKAVVSADLGTRRVRIESPLDIGALARAVREAGFEPATE